MPLLSQQCAVSVEQQESVLKVSIQMYVSALRRDFCGRPQKLTPPPLLS